MAHFQIDMDSAELCLIDSGIKTLDNVPVRPNLQVLNLHSNYISRIENLSCLQLLRHLDLSSNQISRIEGLDRLVSLRTLNLSCNVIAVVEGLENLRSLVKVNLSYNQIEDISGFARLSSPDCRLTHLELHGNNLTNCTHIVKSLSRCGNLRELILSQDGSANPVCHNPGYREEILRVLPFLLALDGYDRSGQLVGGAEILADIPGLEAYMEYLLSDGVNSEPSSVNLATPKIDQVLETFRQKTTLRSDESSMSLTDVQGNQTETEQEDHAVRLAMLENQIADLMSQSKKNETPSRPKSTNIDAVHVRSPRVKKLVAKRDVDLTDESDSESSHKQNERRKSRKSRKSKIPSYQRSTSSSRSKKAEAEAEEAVNDYHDDDQAESAETKLERAITKHGEERIRDDIQSTYIQLMRELEEERERRWKAEQATRKLVNHVKELQTKHKNEDQLRDTVIEATSRLKLALTNEREAKLRLKDQVDTMKEQLQQLVKDLRAAKETEENQKSALKAMEETTAKMEREQVKQHAHEHKKTQESQMRASALAREVEMLQSTVHSQKGQLHQLQELLANREQEHREELKKRYSLDSPQLQNLLEQEVRKAEKQYANEMKNQQDKIDQLSKQYSELEDEFRMALQIEASRFKELQDAFQNTSEENAQNKQILLSSKKTHDEMTAMINELTALVKEQKGRIAELSKSKQEQVSEYRERNQNLEIHVEEARKRMIQLELLKQDKTKLLAQVEAQESVIAGLKSERKLWGHELAQQGASLAQDRGRLDSKIETLASEVTVLKKQLERETDGLKIKTKMLEDQTETIRKLKEGLVERDEEIKQARGDAIKIQQKLEDQLAEERSSLQDTQLTVDRLRERKLELKGQVSDLQLEIEESKKAHSVMNTKWKEKSQFIGQLEKQVQQIKPPGEQGEENNRGKRQSLGCCQLAVDKLRSVDDAFRKQLETKEQKHQEDLVALEQEKQAELDQANHRVLVVEEEMRELLQDTQNNKRMMEDKMKRLTRAMSELQTDIYS
ncbi:hypothetical protein ScPMuIL_001561 [Solemya velum]